MAKVKSLFLNLKHRRVKLIILSIIIIISAVFTYIKLASPSLPFISNISSINLKKDAPQILFLSEVYDTIEKNYWEKISEQDLVNLFKAASDKAGGNPIPIPSLDKKGLFEMFENVMSKMNNEEKNEFSKQTAAIVLANLKPSGRSALYTTRQEKQLKNLVQNINPEKDLYQDLNVEKDASAEQIEEAYQQKQKDLAADTSDKAKEELAKAEYAKEVLANEDNKKLYDEEKVEPTIFSQRYNNVLYVYFKRFSPTTLEQFQKTLSEYDIDAGPTSLILDFRGNVGGEIDAVPYYLGNFLGANQYAYDFYQQGEYKPFRTKTDKLSGIQRFKQTVILVDNNTQSSAEIMVASLKSRRFGIVLGVPTKGWGTVERVFPIDHQIDENERLSLFLVHHITIRDDGQPIEGRGVEPTINVLSEGWEQELNEYFRNPFLTQTVNQVWQTRPF